MDIFFINGNWVDLVIIIFLITFLISGFERGFIVNSIDLVGFVLSFAIALKYYSFISVLLVSNFSLPKGIANALGFIFLGFALETILFVIARLVYQMIPIQIRGSKINKWLGPVPAFINGLVVVAFFLTVVVATPVQPRIKQAIINSQLGGPLISHTQIIEREISSIFGEAVLDTLSFITIPAESEERVDLGFTTTEVTNDPEAELQMFTLINEERKKVGLSVVVVDIELKEVARHHGVDMFSKGYFSHVNTQNQTPFDRIEEANIDFIAAGENLAFAPTVKLAHQGLMQSPGHRANILSTDFGKVGIGVVDAEVYGKIFVQNFTD